MAAGKTVIENILKKPGKRIFEHIKVPGKNWTHS